MKVGIYARVSTLNKGQDVEVQLNPLRTYAQQRGWTIWKEFCDSGISGAKESRPALNELLKACRQRKIDCILVWKLDRLGRSLKHLITLMEELKQLNIALVSLSEVLDFSTSSGKLMLGIFASLAEFERDLIRERVLAGIENAKRKGKVLGRPSLDNAIIAKVANLRQKGFSLRGIAKELSVSLGAVHKILKKDGTKTPVNKGVET